MYQSLSVCFARYMWLRRRCHLAASLATSSRSCILLLLFPSVLFERVKRTFLVVCLGQGQLLASRCNPSRWTETVYLPAISTEPLASDLYLVFGRVEERNHSYHNPKWSADSICKIDEKRNAFTQCTAVGKWYAHAMQTSGLLKLVLQMSEPSSQKSHLF